MQGLKVRQPFTSQGTCPGTLRPQCSSRANGGVRQPAVLICAGRQQLSVTANWNPFDKGSGGGGNKEDAARRAIEQSFKAKKFGADAGGKKEPSKPAQPPTPPPPGDAKGGNPLQNLFKGMGGGAGAGTPPGGGGGGGPGGGGGFGGFGAQPEGEGGAEKSIQQEFLELMKGAGIVLGNLTLFLIFADMLHRSLNWFVQTELLIMVGAPQAAGERTIGKFFEVIEWFERHVLGWTLPGDEEEEMGKSKVYEVLQNYTPAEAAYSFYQMKHKLTYDEAQTMHKAYALRHWERADGERGDVDWAEVERIKAKYDPLEADRRAYQRAKAAGKLDEYWAANGGAADKMYGEIVGRPRTA